MKYLLFFLLTVFLYGCSSQAGKHVVKDISKQVQKCCASFTVGKTAIKSGNSACTGAESSSFTTLPMSVFEITGKLATW